MKSRIVILLLAVVAASGCAYTSQTVVIEPKVEVAESNIGEGHPVAVHVVDERTSTEIGRRGSGMVRGAAITSEQDMADVFANEIVKGLETMNFDAVLAPSAGAGGALLRVDIRSIEHETSTGFWTGGVHVRGAIKATATRGANTYDQMYRVDDEKRVMVVPGADSNAEQINTTVSAVLQEMFNDAELFRFLAE